MKLLLNHLQKFFDIDNPILLVAFLFLIIFNRFTLTFFNASHHVATPDNYYYAGQTVGTDWIAATVTQAYRLKKGLPLPPQLTIGYGYTFTILTAWSISFLEAVRICSPADHLSCQFILYNVAVTIAIAGLLALAFMLVKSQTRRATALLFLIAFLLGVPGGRGIETANLDILLSVLYGLILYLQRISLQDTKRKHIYPILIGAIAGAMLQTKLFILPIALVFLFCSTEPITFLFSFLATMGIITIIPAFYGLTPNPFQVVQAAQLILGPITSDLYKRYTYGNNNTRAMVGSVIFSINSIRSNPLLQTAFVGLGGVVLFVTILALPMLSFLQDIYNQITHISLRDRLQYPFFIALNCYAVAAIILWPGMSYDYRFFYLIPLIYILLDTVKTAQAQQFLGVALGSLLIRSLFVLHTKVWHVFLLTFFYFFLLVCLSVWIHAQKSWRK